MRFTVPLALLLLGVILVFVYLGWPARGYGRWRETLSLALRVVIALCLVLALAGLELVRASSDLAVVFLLDRSDSLSPAAQAEAVELVRQAMAGMRADDQAAVVAFGADALVERPMRPGSELGEITSAPLTTGTDLAKAIRLGLALFPPQTARRMVLISDGAATQGNASAAAQLAAAGGVQILALPLASEPEAEVRLTAVETPERLRVGDNFSLNLTIEASAATTAAVRVLAGDEVVYQGEHTLQRGEQSFSLPLTAGETGFIRYRVQIEPQQDGHYQNNELASFSQVLGPPRILLVAPPAGETYGNDQVRTDEAAALRQALLAAGFGVEQVTPVQMGSDLVELAPYGAVVLVDVPARELSQRQMLALQSYVRDLGGGLVAVGGPTSYGVGGYFRTPLEESLPVEMQIKDQQRRPALTIVFIIDHSGSMSSTSGGVTKLELAKEAAARSVEMMWPNDRVGVIAFDEDASWVVPVRELDDPAAVMNAIGSIRSGGGTDILAGLQAMAGVLPGDPASVKHVILLTDGGADPTGIPELVTRLNQENGITLTTVAVGEDAAQFLPDLARLGGGRFHFTADPAAIPRIFTEETSLVSRAYLVEEPFTPLQAGISPILAGIQAVPQLHGYVATSLKSVAQPVLVSERGDPILATWQYGLGRAAAFTSDASGRWAQEWLGWEGFGTFWAQVANFTARDLSASALQVRVEHGSAAARLVVEAQDESGAYLNDYDLQARVAGPDGQVAEVELAQVAPGRYAGEFTPSTPGAYLIGVAGEGAAGDGLSETGGWVMSYSPEYRGDGADTAALRSLAAGSGGYLLENGQAGEIFAHDLPNSRTVRPVWPWLLGLAALLLPLDVAVRRLVVTREELRRGWARLAARFKRAVTAAEPAAVPRTQRMDALLKAKQRAVEAPEAGAPDTGEPEERSPVIVAAPPPAPAPAPEPPRQEAPPTEEPPAEKGAEPTSTAASLLASRRAKRRFK